MYTEQANEFRPLLLLRNPHVRKWHSLWHQSLSSVLHTAEFPKVPRMSPANSPGLEPPRPGTAPALQLSKPLSHCRQG